MRDFLPVPLRDVLDGAKNCHRSWDKRLQALPRRSRGKTCIRTYRSWRLRPMAANPGRNTRNWGAIRASIASFGTCQARLDYGYTASVKTTAATRATVVTFLIPVSTAVLARGCASICGANFEARARLKKATCPSGGRFGEAASALVSSRSQAGGCPCDRVEDRKATFSDPRLVVVGAQQPAPTASRLQTTNPAKRMRSAHDPRA